MSSSKGRARPRGARGSGSGHSPSGNSGIVQSPIPHARRQRANLDDIGKSRSAAAFLPEQTLCWSVNSIRGEFRNRNQAPRERFELLTKQLTAAFKNPLI